MNFKTYFYQLNEDSHRDSSFRDEARNFTIKLKRWLGEIKNNPLEELKSFMEPVVNNPKYNGGIIFKAKWIDKRYMDLSILMMPKDQNEGSYQAMGGFGRSADGKTSLIVIYNLLEPWSLVHCDTRINIRTMIHEFIHYLDGKREKSLRGSGKSSHKLRGGDDVGYYNDSAEFNAYFQEMASSLDNMFGPDSILRSHPEKFQEISTWEGFKTLAKKVATARWQALMVPKYQKKFLKRLYNLYLHLVRNSDNP